jgi:uncharacterized protein YndB with AHSA1/START domain
MRLATSATIEIAQPRERVFDFATATDTFAKIFRARGPVAAIVGAELLDGATLGTGARRRMTMGDGAVLIEEVIAFDRPSRHAYRWSGGLRAPGKFLVRTGEADWRFEARGERTRIDWGYTFELTTPLIYPAAAFMIGQFRKWMEQQLRAIDTALAG